MLKSRDCSFSVPNVLQKERAMAIGFEAIKPALQRMMQFYLKMSDVKIGRISTAHHLERHQDGFHLTALANGYSFR